MPEALLYDSGLQPRRQQQHRTLVPQVVEAQVGQVGVRDHPLELRHPHIDMQRLAQLPSEDETTVLSQLAQPEALAVLFRAVLSQPGSDPGHLKFHIHRRFALTYVVS
jgi:hypothetical protein